MRDAVALPALGAILTSSRHRRGFMLDLPDGAMRFVAPHEVASDPCIPFLPRADQAEVEAWLQRWREPNETRQRAGAQPQASRLQAFIARFTG